MGRGATWSDVECGHLARAWLTVSQDPLLGMEQTSATFFKKLFELFCTIKPANASEKGYDSRGLKASRSKFEAILADIQKFQIVRRELWSFNPTGTNTDHNLSMAIARHLGKVKNITYEAKDFPQSEWMHHLAFKELRELPNLNDQF